MMSDNGNSCIIYYLPLELSPLIFDLSNPYYTAAMYLFKLASQRVFHTKAPNYYS
jgi:hypothetical protein